MKEILKRGATSNILRVFLPDSTSTSGAGKTGLTNSSSGLIISTIADVEATATTYTSAASNVETITTLGTFAAPSSGKARLKEVDATNFPGIYEIQIADARFNVSNATTLLVSVLCTGVAPTFAEVQLVTVDLYDSTRFGLTALPNAAAEASGGLATLSAAQSSNGTIPVNLKTIAGQTANAAAAVTFPASIGTSTLDAAGAADAVWDEILSGHLSTGSTGAALNAAGSSGDPWTTSLPGAYGTGTAGYIIGTNLDALVSTRLASSSILLTGGAVTVGTNNDKTGYSLAANSINTTSIQNGAITAIKIQDGAITNAKLASGAISSSTFATDAITSTVIAADAITSAELASSSINEIADAVWGANYATSSGGSAWANNTFGDRVVISDSNNQNEVAITGSNHIAADIHEIQPDEIIDIAQGVLSEATSTNPATYAAGDVGNVLGRLVNMIAADGADFQFTANALELAPSGGGGGGSTTVRMGPFVIKAEGQGSEEPLDINKGATHAIECQLVDAEGTGVDITGATLTAKVYNSAGTLVETVSGTISYAALGQVRWTIGTTTTNTAGTYTVTITRTTGASDTQIFGPLRVYVRDI